MNESVVYLQYQLIGPSRIVRETRDMSSSSTHLARKLKELVSGMVFQDSCNAKKGALTF